MNTNKTIITEYRSCDKEGDFEFGNIDSSYSATNRYFTESGSPFIPLIGEFHFSRYDNSLWDRELSKMRSEGLNGVAVYVFWNHHEIKPNKFEFDGDKDIHRFLELCKKYELKVVLRIGPWCHGEARLGGYPDYLRFVIGKRKTTPLYMYYVKRYWTRLFEEVKEFCDGKTVIGIQMENEYGGNISHIYDLRNLAESIGFKTPFFTMTKWPTDTPSKHFLPMEGGYPEAPWTQHKRPLEPNNRFAIMPNSNDGEIGADLIKTKRKERDFSDFPLAGCEVGTGNQVTAHRRPVISDRDGYGVAFAKVASGMNWMGYYMYHGGRNPLMSKPMQESRITLYPNNYPIIDYDFQAPISKDGKVRKHGDRLRLMHIFLGEWDKEFAKTQAFFAKESDMPYISARVNEENGYVFISNYERGLQTNDESVDIVVSSKENEVSIKSLTVNKDEMIFFPINCDICGEKFDYITAQPILKRLEKDGPHAYFMRGGMPVRISRNGVESVCAEDRLKIGDVTLEFMSEEKALTLHYIDGRILYSHSPIYRQGDMIVAELFGGDNVSENGEVKISLPDKNIESYFELIEIEKVRLEYDYFMYSKGKRGFYLLKVDKRIFDSVDDIEVTLDFKGLNLQIFHCGELVDDYFNTDGKCVFRLKRLKRRLLQDGSLVIRACAKTKRGVGNPYNEIDIKDGELKLSISKVTAICMTEI